MYYPMNEWKLKGFEKAKAMHKKYTAIIMNKEGKTKKINFGDDRYSHYKDRTGLGLFSYLNHNDPDRRRLYHLRHNKDVQSGSYSAGYFALEYLW